MNKKLLSIVLSVSVLTGATSMTTANGVDKKPVVKTKAVISAANVKITESTGLSKVEMAAKDSLSTYLKALESNRNFSGQVLIEKNGKVLIDRAYGYADYENKIKAKTSTTFCIGSITKQFTAAAIAQLAEKKKLAYTDKVSKYLKNVPYGDKITLHQLLTHTSGLFNYTSAPDFMKMDPTNITFDKIIALMKDKPLDFEPGKGYSYSNTGYTVLGKIVEKVSGETLESYLTNNIFKPIGMNSTKVAYAGKKKLVEAKGYTGYLDVTLDTRDEVALNASFGAGFLCSTSEDILKWDKALLAGKVVTSKQLNNIFKKQTHVADTNYYGYGWLINENENEKIIRHGGGTGGFTAENTLLLDKKAKVIILVNKGHAYLNGIERNMIKLIDGQKIDKVEKYCDYSITPEQMDKFIGTYGVGNQNMVVEKDSDKLKASIEGNSYILHPLNDYSFYVKEMEVELEFEIDSVGKVLSVIVNMQGESRILNRQLTK